MKIVFYRFEVYDYSTKCQQTVNIVQYFKKKFNYDVKYPNLPCFQVGNLNKKYVVPIEVTFGLTIFRL